MAEQKRHSRLTDEQRMLAAQWVGLVPFVLKKHPDATAKLGRSEARSVGYDALVRAASLFDPKFGTTFSTYAVEAIRNSLFRALSRSEPSVWRVRGGKKACVGSLDAEVVNGEGVPASLASLIAGVSDSPQDAVDAIDAVEWAMRSIDQRWRQVVEMRFAGKTLLEVSREFGISRERVRQIEAKALARMRAILEGA